MGLKVVVLKFKLLNINRDFILMPESNQYEIMYHAIKIYRRNCNEFKHRLDFGAFIHWIIFLYLKLSTFDSVDICRSILTFTTPGSCLYLRKMAFNFKSSEVTQVSSLTQ